MIRFEALQVRRLLTFVAVFLVMASATGCAPTLGLRLSVPLVPDPQRSVATFPEGEPLRVRVGGFIDGRPSDTVAVIDGREVGSDGSVTAVVQEGLERYLRTAGANVVIFSAPSIEGEIVEWKAGVTPKFPASEATASARVKIEIRAAGSRVVYRATYAGEAKSTHPFLSEQSVRDLLSQAMGSALEEAVHDEDLVNALANNRTM